MVSSTYNVLFTVVVALAFRGRFKVCLFFDLRKSVSEVYNVYRDYTYISRTIGIETLVGDNKSIDMVVHIHLCNNFF